MGTRGLLRYVLGAMWWDCTSIESGGLGPRGEVEDLEKKAFAEEVFEKTGWQDRGSNGQCTWK